MKSIAVLMRGTKDGFFHNSGDLDRGRMKVSKFWSKVGWMLCCDFWPLSSGHSNIRMRAGEDRQRWLDFHKMLKSFLSKVDYTRWFANTRPTSNFPSESKSLSYADKVRTLKRCQPS